MRSTETVDARTRLTALDLTGKVAIVTGSGRGLGCALAEGHAAAGAGVIVCARTADEAYQTAASIREHRGTALASDRPFGTQ